MICSRCGEIVNESFFNAFYDISKSMEGCSSASRRSWKVVGPSLESPLQTTFYMGVPLMRVQEKKLMVFDKN